MAGDRGDFERLQESAIRVAILEDHELMREVLSAALSNEGFQVVSSGDPAGFFEAVQRHAPDVAIVDLTFDLERATQPADGFGVLRQMRQAHPAVRLLVFSATSSQASVDNAFQLGAQGYLFKSTATVNALRQAIARLLAGERVRPQDFPALPEQAPLNRVSGARPVRLTDRERQVLDLVGSGANNISIAGKLRIKERTVKAHVSSLYRKLGSENRVELALLANSGPRASDK